MAEKKLGFKTWFDQNGNELLRGWLRAREDECSETFSDWVLGEYDCYLDSPHPCIVEDEYEIPYHGVVDNSSKFEIELGL